MTVQRKRHTGAFHRNGTIRGQKQSGGVAHLFDALAAHVEAADLVGRAEAVLHGAQHAQRRLGVTFELAHHVDQMFQGTRSGDRTVLRDMADQQYRNVKRLRGVDQCARHFAHLGGAAGDAVDVLRNDGLCGIHDRQRRPDLFDQAQYRSQIGGGGQQHVWFDRIDAGGAHAHLCLRFLAGNIQDDVAVTMIGDLARHIARRFQQQRRFADAGLACDQRHRSGNDAGAQHTVEFEKPVGILDMFSVPISVIGLAAEEGTAPDCVRDVRPGAAVREAAEGRAS